MKLVQPFICLILLFVFSGMHAEESILMFGDKCRGSGTANDSVFWIVTSDATERKFDKSRGIHYGASDDEVSFLQLTTEDICGTITEIVVKAAGANDTNAQLDVMVGGNALDSTQTLTSSAVEYHFKGACSGTIVVRLTQNSRKSALYVKSIVVTYIPSKEVVLTVGPTGYATLYYSNCSLVVPPKVTAYTYRLSANGICPSKRYDAHEVIPAGTAVIVEAEAGKYVFDLSVATGMSDSHNILLGTDISKQLEADADSYFYQLNVNAALAPESVGFYWGNASGSAFINRAHKAYLKLRKATARHAKQILFREIPTSINTLISTLPVDSKLPMYNLAGQEVDKYYKGIVIRKGKKFILR